MTHIFIINPYAGQKTFADDLRTKLNSIEGLNFFAFNTRYAGYETVLVKKIQNIFRGERLRFYCCGGSGTMRNMLNGFDDLSQVEIAFFPCGLTNDFLKMFGKDEARFSRIEELICGDTIKVDYIKSNHGVSLNTLSTGLDANCVDKMNDYRILRYINPAVPYTLGVLYSIFVSPLREYEVILDGKANIGKFAEVFIGNGCIFGGNMFFDEHTCIDDGQAISRIIGNKRGFSLIPTLTSVTGRKYDKLEQYMDCSSCRTISMRRTDGEPFTINMDGDLIYNVTDCTAEIVHKGLRLVVPKGVTVS